jgi:SpoVK/Ycf46/Vps4 family AAA+-type ATPase
VAVDPEVVRTLERLVLDEPENHAVRLHLIDLLLADGQHAAALGHCDALRRAGEEGDDVAGRTAAARAGLGMGPGKEAVPSEDDVPAPSADVAVPSDDELVDLVRPELTLADVAGMDEVKERLRLSFLAPLRNPDVTAAFGLSVRSSLLLWGPPGCGKTYLARALAGELGLCSIHLGIADVLDMWVGSSERNVRRVFEEARRLRPAVLFIDELDALGHKRSRLHSSSIRNVSNQLLVELDGAEADNEGLLVLGATNQPWDLDPALLRPGRFDRQVLVLPPDQPARRAILAHHLRDAPQADDVDLDAVAARSDGLSGADLALLCSRATQVAFDASLRQGRTCPVAQAHLEEALADTPRSTDTWFRSAESYVQFADDGDRYEELRRHLAGRRGRRRR